MKNRDAGHLYERLLNGDEAALIEVYDKYKTEFLNYFKSYDINDESVLDIYQETIVVVYQKFVNDKVKLEKSSLKTYLFGIGKNKTYDYFKRKKIYSNNIEKLKTVDENYEFEKESNIYEKLLAKNLKLISESCQHILKLFYYRGLSIKEIVEQTDYKDENTVKSHKSRCLKKLKELCNSN